MLVWSKNLLLENDINITSNEWNAFNTKIKIKNIHYYYTAGLKNNIIIYSKKIIKQIINGINYVQI